LDQDLGQTLDKYLLIRSELKNKRSHDWAKVVELCNRVSSNPLDLQAIWISGRDKPCWSNITVAGGERIANDLKKSADFDSFHKIASDDWMILKNGKGPSWNSSSNFNIDGQAVKKFIDALNPGGFKSYIWKLYSIRQLALAFSDGQNKIHTLIDDLISKQFIGHESIGPWTKRFEKYAGFGWGYITTNHMLADLGLSIKPDLHVRRSGVKLGMTINTPTGLRDEEIDALPAKIDFEIVCCALQLAEYLEPISKQGAKGTYKNKIALREMDKSLMEWSRQGLSRAL